MGAKNSGLLPPFGHANRMALQQAVTVCIPMLLIYLACWHLMCSTRERQLAANPTLATQPVHTRTRPVLASLAPTTAAVAVELQVNLSAQTRGWFMSHPSSHCARHELPVEGYVSQSPFASGDTFRSMADHTFDDYSDIPGDTWNYSHIKPCDIIFVKTDVLLKFFKERHTKINVTYILLSSNSAYSVPVDRKSPCKKDLCSRYLKDPQLGHWYGKNMLPGYSTKTTPLPIGLASERWPHGKSRMVLDIAQSAPAWEDRETSVHIAMKKSTHKERSKVVKQMSSLPGALHVQDRVEYETYLRQVANSKFVAAPRGSGIDTHRAWEAMYLGAVPIIQKSPLDWLYEGLPVLLVEDFAMVNSSLLESYAASRSRTTHYNTERAWAVYWHQELQRMQRLVCNPVATG